MLVEHPEAVEVVRRLSERGLTFATAESSTGGLVSHLIVTVPGASRVFIGGAVAYGRGPKLGWLRVPVETIETNGSVHEATALAMARGAREALGVDIAVAETGIASDNDNPERPGGLWCLAIVGPDGYEHAVRHHFEGERQVRMHQAASQMLHLVLAYLDEAAET
ncbi:MAG: CinA family protein [Dehalococcoidia bacterium]